MNSFKNKITIGMTVYKEGGYLLEAWNSVLNQTDNSWEAIMVLDGGADVKTKRIFNNISHPSLRKIKLGENNGPYYCRTLAIKKTETDWYCHLDADDLLPENMVNNINATIEKYSDIQFIIGNCIYFDKKCFNVKFHKGLNDSKLAYTLPFNGQSPIKCELFNQVGGYEKSFYRGGADWDFWIKVLEADIKGKIIDDIIYERRVTTNSVGDNWVHRRHEFAKNIIRYHPKYFNSSDKKNLCLSKSYEFAAREFKKIGKRKEAAKLANCAMKFDYKQNNMLNIIEEGEMPLWRYLLRRLGRHINIEII